eukprot:scaffold113_cov339-Pavlova_lutheri.AAC.16
MDFWTATPVLGAYLPEMRRVVSTAAMPTSGAGNAIPHASHKILVPRSATRKATTPAKACPPVHNSSWAFASACTTTPPRLPFPPPFLSLPRASLPLVQRTELRNPSWLVPNVVPTRIFDAMPGTPSPSLSLSLCPSLSLSLPNPGPYRTDLIRTPQRGRMEGVSSRGSEGGPRGNGKRVLDGEGKGPGPGEMAPQQQRTEVVCKPRPGWNTRTTKEGGNEWDPNED